MKVNLSRFTGTQDIKEKSAKLRHHLGLLRQRSSPKWDLSRQQHKNTGKRTHRYLNKQYCE